MVSYERTPSVWYSDSLQYGKIAGISIESISGSSTAVYTGSFSMDYMLQLSRDPEDPPPYAAVGFGLSMLANRISWFFNFCGPSVGLDSACSSTATAIDVACQSLRDGSTNMVCFSTNTSYNNDTSTYLRPWLQVLTWQLHPSPTSGCRTSTFCPQIADAIPLIIEPMDTLGEKDLAS